MSDAPLTITAKLPARRPRTPAVDAAIQPIPARQPLPAQTAIALAFTIESALLAGEVKSYSEAAKRLGLSAARVNQLSQLVGLSPRVVEGVVAGEIEVSVRALERVARFATWSDQERLLASTSERKLA